MKGRVAAWCGEQDANPAGISISHNPTKTKEHDGLGEAELGKVAGNSWAMSSQHVFNIPFTVLQIICGYEEQFYRDNRWSEAKVLHTASS